MSESGGIVHATADLSGVAADALHDERLLSGLLIAAVGAAGLATVGAPMVRVAPAGGIAALLFLDPCHVSLYTLPDRGLVLVDVLARDASGAAKALDVFVRRLAPSHVTRDTRIRGAA